jgi:hypothetical protein
MVVGNLVVVIGRAGQISVEAILAASATLGHPAQSLHQGIPDSPLLGAAHISTAATRAPKNVANGFHHLGPLSRS